MDSLSGLHVDSLGSPHMAVPLPIPAASRPAMSTRPNAALTRLVLEKGNGAWTKPTQSALAALAACWLAICSFIFCCISFGVGSAMWVATTHM